MVDASDGGTDLISCQNVTGNDRDFCCDHTNNCCDTGVGRFRLDSAGKPVKTIGPADKSATLQPSTSITTSASTTISPPIAATKTVTSSPLPTPSPLRPSSSLSNGAKAGIAVGGLVGFLSLIALLYFLWRRKRQGGGQEELATNNEWGKPEMDAQASSHLPNIAQGTSGWAAELPAKGESELQGGSTAWELPTTYPKLTTNYIARPFKNLELPLVLESSWQQSQSTDRFRRRTRGACSTNPRVLNHPFRVQRLKVSSNLHPSPPNSRLPLHPRIRLRAQTSHYHRGNH